MIEAEVLGDEFKKELNADLTIPSGQTLIASETRTSEDGNTQHQRTVAVTEVRLRVHAEQTPDTTKVVKDMSKMTRTESVTND